MHSIEQSSLMSIWGWSQAKLTQQAMELHSEKAKDQHSLNATFVNLGFDKETVGYSILDLQKVLVPKKEISMSRNLLQIIKK